MGIFYILNWNQARNLCGKLTRKDQETIYMMEFPVSHTSDPISKNIICIMLYHMNVEQKATS